MSLRVLIVDDQTLVRTGFRMILEAEEDIEVSARRETVRRPSPKRDGSPPTSC
jgi:DNA-binding NarL/FixJ family response regulator